MGCRGILILAMGFFLNTTLCCASLSHPIYLASQEGRFLQAFEQLGEMESQDYDVLRAVAYQFLQSGGRQRDPKILALTAYGAALSEDHRASEILRLCMDPPYPAVQQEVLQLLAQQNNQQATQILREALGSPFWEIRLQAVYLLAERRGEGAFDFIESLMAKIPSDIHPLLAPLYAHIGGPEATLQLRKMLHSSSLESKRAAILSTIMFQRTDLLPDLRMLATQLTPAQQESCATAFGILGDHKSIPLLTSLSHSSHQNVQVAALWSLLKLDQKEELKRLEALALQGNLFAIYALKDFPESSPSLLSLLRHRNPSVQANAMIALVTHLNPEVLPFLSSFLERNESDYGITPLRSQGFSLLAWKMVPSITEQWKKQPERWTVDLSLRKYLLTMSQKFPEEIFLELASFLFERKQLYLIPHTVSLLEQLQSPSSIALLRKCQHQWGVPLLRHSCQLALYRSGLEQEEGLLQWVRDLKEQPLIQFQTTPTWNPYESIVPQELSLRESSQLLIESLEALANQHSKEAIETLLYLLQKGHESNRYVLAGLLIKAIQ